MNSHITKDMNLWNDRANFSKDTQEAHQAIRFQARHGSVMAGPDTTAETAK